MYFVFPLNLFLVLIGGQGLHPKCHPIPYVVHNGTWLKEVHYRGNSLPFGMFRFIWFH